MKTKLLSIISLILLGYNLSFAQSGLLDFSFNIGTGANNYVRTTTIQPDGKIIIGGDFTFYNGTAINRIARLNVDGSLDTSFNPGTGANYVILNSLIQPDGKIIISGQFNSYDGTAINRIARLNVDGSLDNSFNPGTGPSNQIFTTSIQTNGKIIIGGMFNSFNGTASNHIARLNIDGSLDTSFDLGTGASGDVWTTVIQPDGKIIISGLFTTYNGTARSKIARLNVDGSLDTSFNPGTGANTSIQTTSIQSDGKITISGGFTSYNGTAINRIARLNVDGSLDTSFDPGTGATNWVKTTSIQADGKIIIGGDFYSFNGIARNRIARLNVDGSLDTSFDPGTGANSDVYTTSIQPDGKIIIGGFFTTYDGMARSKIARLEGTPVGINQLVNEVNNVNLFPNPFSNTTTLYAEVELKNATLTLYNSFGQSVKQLKNINGQTFALLRDKLPSGLYFVRLTEENDMITTTKIIITD